MFATVKCYSCFWLLLWLALLLPDHTYARKHIGEKCSTPHGPGVCQLIDQCPSVFVGLRSDNRPITCGFKDQTLTVCCPSENSFPPPRNIPVWSEHAVTHNMSTRSVNTTSTQMCAEYEKLFFNPETLIQYNIPRNPTNRTDAKVWEFPHMAAIGFNKGSTKTWECGGTLISDRFVLTAAHCLYHYQWGHAKWVRVGYLGPEKSIVEPQLLRIIERIKHPEYNPLMKYNDIALLKLEPSVVFNPLIKPACLDTKDYHMSGETAVASGWGLTDFDDKLSRSANLSKVELPIVAHSNCASLYVGIPGLPRGLDDRTQICAGEKGKDTCEGDSGGPLVMKTKALSLHRVVGITSFGASCGGFIPGVYTRVSSYRSWIESIVWPDKSAGDAQWVRLGSWEPNKRIIEPQVLRIIEIIKHPDFKASMKYNDIALLKLERSVTFNSYVKPACLDTQENHPDGEEAWTTGWRLTTFDNEESRSTDFLRVKLPIVAHSNCANLYGKSLGLPHGIDDHTQICAGEKGKDTCEGDSGDSLVIKTKALSLHRVIGITSFGQGCDGIVPAVYTRVFSYVSWIESIVWPDKSA